ncbi:MAG: hypothetical protein WCC54_15540, partial [Pseudolabrys sp.]
NARFPEQGGIGGETGYPWLPGHLDDLGLVGTVREKLDFQLCQGWSIHFFLVLRSRCVKFNIGRLDVAFQCAGELFPMELLLY